MPQRAWRAWLPGKRRAGNAKVWQRGGKSRRLCGSLPANAATFTRADANADVATDAGNWYARTQRLTDSIAGGLAGSTDSIADNRANRRRRHARSQRSADHQYAYHPANNRPAHAGTLEGYEAHESSTHVHMVANKGRTDHGAHGGNAHQSPFVQASAGLARQNSITIIPGFLRA